MEKLYICTEDRQGGSFALGRICNIEGWRNYAMSWADSDDNDEMYSYLEALKDEKVIPTIDEIWELTIEPLDEVVPTRDTLQDMFDILEYISENLVLFSEMQSYVSMYSEEYGDSFKYVLDKARGLIEDMIGVD